MSQDLDSPKDARGSQAFQCLVTAVQGDPTPGNKFPGYQGRLYETEESSPRQAGEPVETIDELC